MFLGKSYLVVLLYMAAANSNELPEQGTEVAVESSVGLTHYGLWQGACVREKKMYQVNKEMKAG